MGESEVKKQSCLAPCQSEKEEGGENMVYMANGGHGGISLPALARTPCSLNGTTASQKQPICLLYDQSCCELSASPAGTDSLQQCCSTGSPGSTQG